MIATSLLFIQCTTDPIPGASGVDGQDGIDGSDGLDGATGTTECAACHNISTAEGVHASYLFSGHSIETTMYDGSKLSDYGNRSSCTACHTTEGFIDYAMSGTVTGEAYPGTDQKITCTTCHDTHTTFDFEGDGFDYALRTLRGVDLIVDENYTINYEGTSNLCANCHQPRRSPPEDDGSGTYKVTSTHWGPHHGPQSTFLEGIQGAELAGSFEYPADASHPHRTGSSCTSCHMGETTGEIDGNHTWIQTETACTTCHPGGAPDSVEGLDVAMLALGELLEEIGIVHEGHPVVGTYDIVDAEAAWNYLLVMEDNSKGTHNPDYAKALIANSVELLTSAE